MKIYPKTGDDLNGLDNLLPYILESKGAEIQMLSWNKIEYVKQVIENFISKVTDIQEITIHPPLIEEYNFEVLSFMNFDTEIQRIKQLIEITQQFKIKINLLYHTRWNLNCWQTSGALERMKSLLKLVENYNITILIENIFSMVDKSNSAVLNIAKEINHDQLKVCLDICHLHCQANIFKFNFNEFLENYLDKSLCEKYVYQIHFAGTLDNDGYINSKKTHGRKHNSSDALIDDYNILKKYNIDDLIIVTEVSEDDYSTRIDQIEEIKMLKKI